MHAQTIHGARTAASTTLALAGFRVALVDNNGLRWFDPYDGNRCREGRYYVDTSGRVQWCGDELPT